MFWLGVSVILVGAVLRTWGAVNHERNPGDQALIFHSQVFALLLVTSSTVLGLVGSILIGASLNFLAGLISFVVFWFSPSFLAVLIERAGF